MLKKYQSAKNIGNYVSCAKGKRECVVYNSTKVYTYAWDYNKEIYWAIWFNEFSNEQKDKYK